MFRESSLVTYDIAQVLDAQRGEPYQVEFDFLKVWGEIVAKKLDVTKLGFFHVHPRGMLQMSSTDINCITGLSIAYGTTVCPFGIVSFNDDDVNSIAHQMNIYSFDARTKSIYSHFYIKRAIRPIGVEWFDGNEDSITEDQLRMLKQMSYGESNQEEV